MEDDSAQAKQQILAVCLGLISLQFAAKQILDQKDTEWPGMVARGALHHIGLGSCILIHVTQY